MSKATKTKFKSGNPDFRIRRRGVSIQFKNGKYATNNPIEIAILDRAVGVERD